MMILDWLPLFNILTSEPTFTIAAHPWLRDDNRSIPLDILIYKLVKSYIHATPFKRAALKVPFVSFFRCMHMQSFLSARACKLLKIYLYTNKLM